MDTTKLTILYESPIHIHPLCLSARFTLFDCRGCHRGPIYGGYFCNESLCYSWFHKECAEASPEINHPSHPEHPLLLTNDKPSSKDTNGDPCDFCGGRMLWNQPCYSCPTCKFNVDFICGTKPSPPTIEYPKCHDHPLVILKKLEEEEKEDEEEGGVSCELCKEFIFEGSYICLECHVCFHVNCVHLSKELNHHPCHPCHPLKLLPSESFGDADDDDTDKSCRFCSVEDKKMLYHCSICNFTMCVACTKNPPPLLIEHTKTHAHPLTLFSKKIEFTCNVCGIKGYNKMPYICLRCDFVIDGICIDLPRVININRHDHRISFTHHLSHHGHGHEPIKCGVCGKSVSQYYGAYTCSVDLNYAVHPRCAVSFRLPNERDNKFNVWDGKELECTPEINEDIAPFKVVGNNLINHFGHETHNLRLHKDMSNIFRNVKSTRCEACIGQVGFEPIYSCEECHFILHEKCANLPKKKRLIFDAAPYTLINVNKVEWCYLCGKLFVGFMYKADNVKKLYRYVDVHCGSISEPFIHDAHIHPLNIYFNIWCRVCHACEREDPGLYDPYMLCCDVCHFNLCFYCATLPEKIWHRSDDEHPLTLCCGRKSSRAKDFCEVCEMELDSTLWFFTCSTCGVNLHVRCVFGDFSRLKVESTFGVFLHLKAESTFGVEFFFKVVRNNRNTRASCSQCHSRCEASVILEHNNGYICSNSCLSSFSGKSYEDIYHVPYINLL